jgi:hypothetical protein
LRQKLTVASLQEHDIRAYLVSRAGGQVTMPGTDAAARLGDAWVSKARTAQVAATRAFDYERNKENMLAGLEWQSFSGR